MKSGLVAIPYRPSLLLKQVPIDIREAASLAPLKNCIKTRKCEDCQCRFWKIFFQNFGCI